MQGEWNWMHINMMENALSKWIYLYVCVSVCVSVLNIGVVRHNTMFYIIYRKHFDLCVVGILCLLLFRCIAFRYCLTIFLLVQMHFDSLKVRRRRQTPILHAHIRYISLAHLNVWNENNLRIIVFLGLPNSFRRFMNFWVIVFMVRIHFSLFIRICVRHCFFLFPKVQWMQFLSTLSQIIFFTYTAYVQKSDERQFFCVFFSLELHSSLIHFNLVSGRLCSFSLSVSSACLTERKKRKKHKLNTMLSNCM